MDKKIEEEKATIKWMIQLYCRKNHHIDDGLCADCQELVDYANMRIQKCPFKETKTFCSSCTVHCYGKDQRAKIKEVMKFSGPRMLLYRPLKAIRHMYDTLKYKRLGIKKENKR